MSDTWNKEDMQEWMKKDKLSQKQAQGMLEILSAQFGVPVPNLSWRPKRTRGQAVNTPGRPTIKLGPGCTFGLEPAVVHEFAHVLSFKQDVYDHGEDFCLILAQVAYAWYGDAARYPWEREYPNVAWYGKVALSRQAEEGR